MNEIVGVGDEWMTSLEEMSGVNTSEIGLSIKSGVGGDGRV